MELWACVDAVIAALPGAAGDTTDRAALTAAVAELVAAADPDPPAAPAFCAHAAACVAGEADPVAALRALVARDLWVAFGCARGDPGAFAALERDYVPAVRGALARMRAPDAVIDEQVQALRARLLVGDGERPARIGEYAGRGGLRRWLRTAAVRQYLNALRAGGREVALEDPDDASGLEPDGETDPELALLKERYRAVFTEALAAAAASLEPLARVTLRYAFVDGLGLDALGRVLRVSRATAHRRLTAARDALLAATQRELAARVAIPADEVASVQRLVRSQLDISVRRLLASVEPPPG